PALVAEHPGVALAFAGEREIAYERFYERCRPLVEQHGDRIRFLGLIRDRATLAAFYSACDVFAVPSRTDCYPSTQVEAMLCGTPVVSTDIPGSRTVVHTTGMGAVVPPLDPAALADGLLAVLGSREAIVARLDEARKQLDPTRALDGYEELLERVATPQ